MYSTVIITASDSGSKGEREDLTGQALANLLAGSGFRVVSRIVVPDDISALADTLLHVVDVLGIDLVITNGGTGVSPRDVTPEATSMVIQREMPGIAEAMRAAGLKKTPHAMLSRAIAGIRGTSLIINLPGSPKGASESLEAVLPAIPHALAKIKGDPSDCAR